MYDRHAEECRELARKVKSRLEATQGGVMMTRGEAREISRALNSAADIGNVMHQLKRYIDSIGRKPLE